MSRGPPSRRKPRQTVDGRGDRASRRSRNRRGRTRKFVRGRRDRFADHSESTCTVPGVGAVTAAAFELPCPHNVRARFTRHNGC